MYKRFFESGDCLRTFDKLASFGAVIPKNSRQSMIILNEEQLEKFMETIKDEPLWYDFFYTEVTTGLRRSEICGLKWCDFDESNGTLLICRSVHNVEGGDREIGETKTDKGKRKIVLPASTFYLLLERKRTAQSEWIFPDLLEPERPTSPNGAYKKLKNILTKAGLPDIRFHDLRHTFATMAPEHGMDVKTLSAIIGSSEAFQHHETLEEQLPTQEETAQNKEKFSAYTGKIRKPGTGGIYELNDHLYEGRYSLTNAQGKREVHTVYAKTREEAEALLQLMIAEVRERINEEKRAMKLLQSEKI